jgi:flagellar motility protein MotE (MotC chaperone)
MRFAPRILPAFCVAAALLLCVKLVAIAMALHTPAVAETAATPQPQPPARSKPEEKVAAVAPAAPEPPRPSMPPPAASAPSAAEMEVLQSLSQRRAELDKQADDLAQREVLLRATEQRIDEKIAKLQTMQASIGDVLKKVDEQEEARLKSLVKIYETMKPKEAARIFEQLDMPVLLNVIERMKEAKAAPILAAMDPEKAKTATLALADRKPGATAAAASPAPVRPAAN